MDKNLFEASLTGNVQVLNALLQKDELILDRLTLTSSSSFSENPLHIATLKGHLNFAMILITKKPTLAMSLDSCRRTPLHLASAEGHVDIVRELLKVTSPDGCRFRDQDGQTPLHLASVNEHLEVIKVLTQTLPDLGRELLENGDTILHICITYNRFEALKLLSQLWNDDELVKLTDRNGNTLLHLAVVHKQIQTVKYLLQKTSNRTNANVINGHGLTPLDVLDHCTQDFNSLEIQTLLMEAKFVRSKDDRSFQISIESQSSQNVSNLETNPFKIWMSRVWNWYLNDNGNWLEKQRGILIVATIVVAVTSFYSGLDPPGGTFTDSKAGPLGNAVQTVTGYFDTFVIQNTIIMLISLLILVILLSGIPLRNKFCLWVLNLAALCILFFVTTTYFLEIAWMSPDTYLNEPTYIMCFAWLLLCLLFGFIHTVFLLIWVVKQYLKGGTATRNNINDSNVV